MTAGATVGDAKAAYNGGDVCATSGFATCQSSGNIEILTAESGTFGTSGGITVGTGTASVGVSGSILIASGDAAEAGAGGSLTLDAGGSQYSTGGNVTATAGWSTDTVGGSILLRGGSGSNSGNVAIGTANTGINPGSSGNIRLYTGITVSEQSGAVCITTGTCGKAEDIGGNISCAAGHSIVASGGCISLSAGDTTANYFAGATHIAAGHAALGGEMAIMASPSTCSSEKTANVSLAAGGATGGVGGIVYFQTGHGYVSGAGMSRTRDAVDGSGLLSLSTGNNVESNIGSTSLLVGKNTASVPHGALLMAGTTTSSGADNAVYVNGGNSEKAAGEVCLRSGSSLAAKSGSIALASNASGETGTVIISSGLSSVGTKSGTMGIESGAAQAEKGGVVRFATGIGMNDGAIELAAGDAEEGGGIACTSGGSPALGGSIVIVVEA